MYCELCPACDGEPVLLGSLGKWTWLRCRQCGCEWHLQAVEEEDYEPELEEQPDSRAGL